MRKKQSTAARMNRDTVRHADPDRCWGWRGKVSVDGYALVSTGSGRWARAHRTRLKLRGVRVPADRMVLHSCHRRECTNPRHLRVGDHADNMRDLTESGRARVMSVDEMYAAFLPDAVRS